ncbi:MAG: glycosyltransferase family 2 protein [Fidelibacterota bacterium]
MKHVTVIQLGGQSLSPSDMNSGDNLTIDFISFSRESGEKYSLAENTLGHLLNTVTHESQPEYLMIIDDRTAKIDLNGDALDLLLLTSLRHPRWGMIYSDYAVSDATVTSDVHLLHQHPGRVRDNQDYGNVFFYHVPALMSVGGFDESLQYNTLYDIRLKLSEKHELVHISNRYSGNLYTVHKVAAKTNVFDYLLASKDAQLEAENVLTSHLKRIGAYLAPQQQYRTRPEAQPKPELVASIVIPVNNRPEFIATAIQSVQAQSIPAVEVIVVVNGGPDDPTIPVVREYLPGGKHYQADRPEVQLLVLQINNIGFCLNSGILLARGEYYVQLDSDDRLKPDAVEKIQALFASDPEIGMVIGSYEVWEKTTAGDLVRMDEIPVVTHDEWTDDNGRNNLLRINGAGAPRSLPISVIKEMGFFGMNDDPYARNYGEDYDMVLRVSEHYRIGRIWDPIYEVIRHEGGTDHSIDQQTVDRNDNAKDYMRLMAIRRRQEQVHGK